ncbi:putative Ral GTPase-activating protein subunit alpha-2 [Paratrimastix pyriformis]|uniref:Ral GTPase-activating protein subunit alpha-2 n=1 Tax=Paratrimastix pyriformis TaxID=342808 RepID=A0ABQ8UDK9_9EUKA|nr:putative Ral GTPase-activating protein subunit alpha-2 [Paratrimastix pyriformis]
MRERNTGAWVRLVVQTLMEIYRQALCLPFRQAGAFESVSGALEVFTMWILNDSWRPAFLRDAALQTFLKRCFSALAGPFSQPLTNVALQVQVCSKILILFRAAAAVYTEMELPTREALLLTLRDIAGTMVMGALRPESPTTAGQPGALGPHMIRDVLRELFEIWTEHGTDSTVAWEQFSVEAKRWTPCLDVLHAWKVRSGGWRDLGWKATMMRLNAQIVVDLYPRPTAPPATMPIGGATAGSSAQCPPTEDGTAPSPPAEQTPPGSPQANDEAAASSPQPPSAPDEYPISFRPIAPVPPSSRLALSPVPPRGSDETAALAIAATPIATATATATATAASASLGPAQAKPDIGRPFASYEPRARRFFVWDRLMHLFGNPNAISQPPNHTVATSCLTDMVDAWLAAGRLIFAKATGAPPHPPATNTLLRIFGAYLLEAAVLPDERYGDGRAMACGALCRIMCRHLPQPVDLEYLAHFIRIFALGFGQPADTRVVYALTHYGHGLFSLGLPATNMLVPVVSGALSRLLCGSLLPPEEVRCDAISMLLSMISLSAWMAAMPAAALSLRAPIPGSAAANANMPSLLSALAATSPTPQSPGGLPASGSRAAAAEGADPNPGWADRAWGEVFLEVLTTLLQAAEKEDSSQNKAMCLWGACLLVFEELNRAVPRAHVVTQCVHVLLRHVRHPLDSVALTSLDAIATLATTLAPAILRLDARLLPSVAEVLCGAIEQQIVDNRTSKKPREAIVGHYFGCLQEVVVSAPSLLFSASSEGLARRLFTVVELALTGDVVPPAAATGAGGHRKKTVKQHPAKGIQWAARQLQWHLLNHLNNFPLAEGPVVVGTELTEADDLGPLSHALHLLYNDDCVLTVVERPASANGSPVARVIVRDATGRYAWDLSPVTRLLTAPASGTGAGVNDTTTDSPSWAAAAAGEEPAGTGPHPAGGGSKDAELPTDGPPEESRSPPHGPASASGPQQLVDEAETPRAPDEDEGMAYFLPSPSRLEPGSKKAASGGRTKAKGPPSSWAPLRPYRRQRGQCPHYEEGVDVSQVDMAEELLAFTEESFPEVPTNSASFESEAVSGALLEGFERLLEGQAIDEARYLHACRPQERRPLLPVEAFHYAEPPTPLLYCRQLLSHLGLLSVANRGALALLQEGPKLQRSLNALDRQPGRECIKIGVVYVAPGQESERAILSNDRASPDFEAFVGTLGWPADLATHRGFLGGLDKSGTNGLRAPYFSTPSLEVIFHVSSWMPTIPQDDQQIAKKRHLGNDIVHVVWCEHNCDYRPTVIQSQFNHVHIIVYPLPSGLYRIQVHRKKEVPLTGPLLDGMVVPATLLGPLVRQTAINANRTVRYQSKEYHHPYPSRRKILNEIVERCKEDVTPDLFLERLLWCQRRTGESPSMTPGTPLMGRSSPTPWTPSSPGLPSTPSLLIGQGGPSSPQLPGTPLRTGSMLSGPYGAAATPITPNPLPAHRAALLAAANSTTSSGLRHVMMAGAGRAATGGAFSPPPAQSSPLAQGSSTNDEETGANGGAPIRPGGEDGDEEALPSEGEAEAAESGHEDDEQDGAPGTEGVAPASGRRELHESTTPPVSPPPPGSLPTEE